MLFRVEGFVIQNINLERIKFRISIMQKHRYMTLNRISDLNLDNYLIYRYLNIQLTRGLVKFNELDNDQTLICECIIS